MRDEAERRRRDKRILELCELVLEAPPAQRSALLASQCGDDADLLNSARAMLAHIEADDQSTITSEQQRDPLDLLGTGSSPVAVGDQIDDFVLLERIGGGGMGTVFRAARTSTRNAQQVAIKVLSAQRTVAIGRKNLADALKQNGDKMAARDQLLQAETLLLELLDNDPKAPRLLEMLNDLRQK